MNDYLHCHQHNIVPDLSNNQTQYTKLCLVIAGANTYFAGVSTF